MDTRDLQSRLIALGYSLGPSGADGHFGRLTTTAVKKFQADRRLDVIYPGTVGPKTIAALNAATPGRAPLEQATLLPWFEEAKRHIGLREVSGPKHNSAIVQWLEFLKAPFRNDEEAWCGTFVGWCIASTMPAEPLLQNPWGSINWLKFGRELQQPALGAVLVFWRGSPSGWQGHVGFYAGERADAYLVRGGNQSNAVTETWIEKSRLRQANPAKGIPGGIRWPLTAPLPVGGPVLVNRAGALSQNEA
jgi:uncharacterized protein (TIGR02594 family)